MSQAMTRQGTQALARPSFIKEGDTRGTENITTADIRPPSLRIAQSTTPEAKASDTAYVDGLGEGMFFNSITKEIYGRGPLDLVVVNQLGHRHIEFAPFNQGGGVVDFNVPDGDPRTEFTTEVKDGKEVRTKPKATKFYDFLVLVNTPASGWQLMAISFKSTQLKKATTLNTILLGVKMPSFALLFKASPVAEKRGTNTFFGWRIDQAGYVTEDVYIEASKIYDSLVGKKVEVTVENDEPTKSDDAF